MKNNKRLASMLFVCLSALGCFADNVCVSTPSTSLVVDATKGKELKFLYYG